ncbi:hypothetical protein CAI21_17135 [Alkalilimnicola ehrlichii]|nr:hypothetical protein CAI21_17135 [Alkalilimnicola ehrlichii]
MRSPLLGLGSFAWGGERIELTQLVVPHHLLGESLTLRAEGDGAFSVFLEGRPLIRNGRVGEPAIADNGEVRVFVRELHARPGTEFELIRHSRMAAIRGLASRFQVSESARGSGMLRLTLEGPDAQANEQTLRSIHNAFVRQNVERKSMEAEKRIEFLDEQLPELRASVDEAEGRFNRFRQDNEAFDLAAEGANLLNQVVEVEQRLAEMDLERSQLRMSYASQHPNIIALDEQMERLRERRREFDSRIRELPQSQQELLRLRREAEVNSALYTAMLNNAQELRVVRAGMVGNVRVVDEAITGHRPVRPNRSLTLAVSVVLGGLLGVFTVFLRNMLRRVVVSPDELEKAFDLSCYAVIPESETFHRQERRAQKGKGAPPILVRDMPEDLASESLRGLRTGLHFALMNRNGRCVALTSPNPSAGKSFLSLNLAYLLAEAGKRTIVVDADLRRGHIHKTLDVTRAPGLSDVIAGKASLDEAIRPVGDSKLHFLPTGEIPPNPSELLMSERLDEVLRSLEESYDLVILDTAPVLAATDGVLVAARAAAVFLAIRAGTTSLAEVRQAVRAIYRDSVPISGFILNRLQQGSARYSNGGYYHYQYSYNA